MTRITPQPGSAGPLVQQIRTARRDRLQAVTSRVVDADAATTVLTVLDAAGETLFWADLGDLARPATEWSPVDNTLAYIALDDRGAAQVRRLDLQGPQAASSLLTTAPFEVATTDLNWAPDGTSVLVIARTSTAPDRRAPYRVTRRMWRYEGLGLVDEQLSDIYRVGMDGDVQRLHASDSGVVSQPRWSPDGQFISFLVAFERHDSDTPGSSLRVWSAADGSSTELLTDRWGWITETCWIPNSSKLLVLGSALRPAASVFSSRQSLWVVEPGKPPRNLTAWLPGGAGSGMQSDLAIDWPAAASNVAFLGDGRTAVFTAEARGRTYVTEVDVLTGESSGRTIGAPDASYALLDVLHDDRDDDAGTQLLVLESAVDLPPRVTRADAGAEWSHQPRQGVEPRRLDVRHYTIPSRDGHPVDTWLVLPSAGTAPYPAALKIHGGPYGSVGDVYGEDVEALVSHGYAVVFHNFRGSYGYGDKNADKISAHWGALGAPDHHSVLDHLIALQLIDPARLGVMGHSHGGFATCWLITQSDRFVAAVAEDPVTNFHALIRTADTGPWFISNEFHVKLRDPPAALLERSPITYAHQCTTPLLLVQGEQDLRTPPEQSDQMYAALWDSGCRVEMLRLPRANHMGSLSGSFGYRHARIDAAVDWFHQHLGTPTPGHRLEKAPAHQIKETTP